MARIPNGRAPHSLIERRNGERDEVLEGFTTVLRYLREYEDGQADEGMILLTGTNGNRIALRPDAIVRILELERFTRDRGGPTLVREEKQQQKSNTARGRTQQKSRKPAPAKRTRRQPAAKAA